MACCPCGAAGCVCSAQCAQCGNCNTTWFWNLTLSGIAGAGCAVLNKTWKLCPASQCVWNAQSGTALVQLEFISASSLWQLKITADGTHFIRYTLAAASFNCTTNNTLLSASQDTGFTCLNFPPQLTVNLEGTCCDSTLSTCCCPQYPAEMMATVKLVSGGCSILNNMTVVLTPNNSNCSGDPGDFGGTETFTLNGNSYCLAIRVACNVAGGSVMQLLNMSICNLNCIPAGDCSTSADTCECVNANSNCNGPLCSDVGNSCTCNPFSLTFNNLQLGLANGLNCIDPGCSGTYNLVVTALIL